MTKSAGRSPAPERSGRDRENQTADCLLVTELPRRFTISNPVMTTKNVDGVVPSLVDVFKRDLVAPELGIAVVSLLDRVNLLTALATPDDVAHSESPALGRADV